MQNGRNKQKHKRRKVVSEEQIAREKLIQISVMPEGEGQMNEVDMFVQKLEPKTSQPTKEITSSEVEDQQSANKWYETSFDNTHFIGARSTLSISKVPIVCSKLSMLPKNSLNSPFSPLNTIDLRVDRPQKQSQRKRRFSWSSFKCEDKCESMRTRLKKGINSDVVSSFQVKNIPLKHKFQKYRKEFQQFCQP